MKLSMDRFEPLLIDMRVNLRGRDIGVAEHFLDDAKIGAVAEQVRGETVPQQMWIDICLQAGMFGVLLYDLPDARGGYPRPASREENFAAAPALHEFRTFARQIRGERFARLASDGHEPCLVSLAGHAQNSIFDREILQPGIGQFGYAQTARVKHFDHGAVAQSERLFCLDAFEQLLDLHLVQCFGQIAFDARK
jgi:hypothetical protein